jgi:peptidoglycan/LPS O-acetylase OafA/YrhL
MNKEQKVYVPELAGLDLLRFLLATVVMFVHYFFFYFTPGAAESPVPTEPFFSLLAPVYRYGGNVVQIFWLLSGFIFQTIYFKPISTHRISFRHYLVLRLSRLYPLHIVTLLVVAALQYLYYQSTHTWFWFDTTDVKHFLLQLLFMGSWYPYFQHSFNVPIWSVSIELFVYIVFFVFAAAGLINKRNLYVLLFVSILFASFSILEPFGRCMIYFFAGCTLAEHLREGVDVKKLFRQVVLIFFPIAALYAVVKQFHTGLDKKQLQILFDILLLPVSAGLLLFFIIAFKNIRSKWLVQLFKQLGDLTYATYLVHFPIILCIVLILRPKDFHIFDRPVFLFGYVATAVTVGWVVCKYYEKPVQAFLRRLYDKEKKASTNPLSQSVHEAVLEAPQNSIVPPHA